MKDEQLKRVNEILFSNIYDFVLRNNLGMELAIGNDGEGRYTMRFPNGEKSFIIFFSEKLSLKSSLGPLYVKIEVSRKLDLYEEFRGLKERLESELNNVVRTSIMVSVFGVDGRV